MKHFDWRSYYNAPFSGRRHLIIFVILVRSQGSIMSLVDPHLTGLQFHGLDGGDGPPVAPGLDPDRGIGASLELQVRQPLEEDRTVRQLGPYEGYRAALWWPSRFWLLWRWGSIMISNLMW